MIGILLGVILSGLLVAFDAVVVPNSQKAPAYWAAAFYQLVVFAALGGVVEAAIIYTV